MSRTEIVARRLAGRFEVDPWGLDADLVGLLAPLADRRWSVAVDGADAIVEGPALLVAPRRLLAPTEAAVIANGVRRSTGRVLRVLGLPDFAPVGALLRRLGGVVDHPAEARSLLRAGHLVLARHDLGVDAPIVDVRTVGWELARRWRVTFTRRG